MQVVDFERMDSGKNLTKHCVCFSAKFIKKSENVFILKIRILAVLDA